MLEHKNKAIRKDYFFFAEIFLLWLVLLAINMSTTPGANLPTFVLMGCTVAALLIGYIFGSMTGLITSLAFVFVYGSYLIYNVLVSGGITELKVQYVVWLFVVPLGSYLSGQMSAYVTGLFWQLERKSDLAEFITIDELTKFLNHKAFFNKLEEEMSRSRRFGQSLTLVIIVLVNETEMRTVYGQNGMSQIILEMARVIEEHTRIIDVKGCIDEKTTAIILPGTSSEGAAVVIEKLNNSLDRISVNINGKHKIIKLRVRLGKAEVRKGEDDIFALYDRALEETKYDLG
ncbi:diguanylate cyclase [Desulfosporosinus sp. FKB]|uniref:GGDEF domain-containing protein n=1 Tax=Desulfosporosinus sp. FKB TaxID=1969835 RepID=UPI000B49D18F|nr:diguanylate cyclase [Desulfosporosinus sp. FKB]